MSTDNTSFPAMDNVSPEGMVPPWAYFTGNSAWSPDQTFSKSNRKFQKTKTFCTYGRLGEYKPSRQIPNKELKGWKIAIPGAKANNELPILEKPRSTPKRGHRRMNTMADFSPILSQLQTEIREAQRELF